MPQFTGYPALRARTFDLQDIQRQSIENQVLQSELQQAQNPQPDPRLALDQEKFEFSQDKDQRAQGLQHAKVLGRYAGATDLGRERDLKARIARMRRSKAWGDLGDLKRELLDLWTEERNMLAKQVMKDIKAQRKEAAR